MTVSAVVANGETAKMSKRADRTDCHRPGAIVPADYRYVFSFALSTSSGGGFVRGYRVNCEVDLRRVSRTGEILADGTHLQADGGCCVAGLRAHGAVFALHSSPGRCTVCGARYIEGDVWLHVPTNQYICVGHDCADKYSLLADRSAFEMAQLRAKKEAQRQGAATRHEVQRTNFLAQHPGLEDALKCNHRIVQDIAAAFVRCRSLSDKQIALVVRIADEAGKPRAPRPGRPEEVHVAAPVGDARVTFRGTVVSVRVEDDKFSLDGGTTTKILVKVKTPEGVWLAWGTAPRACLDATANEGIKGCEVEITAKLKASQDAHFAIMNRPYGTVVGGHGGGA